MQIKINEIIDWVKNFPIRSFFLVRIFLYSDWIRRFKCPNTELFLIRIFMYSVRIQENTDQKKLRIWTLFTQLYGENTEILNSLRQASTWFSGYSSLSAFFEPCDSYKEASYKKTAQPLSQKGTIVDFLQRHKYTPGEVCHKQILITNFLMIKRHVKFKHLLEISTSNTDR